MLHTLLQVVLLLLPPYIANGTPPVVTSILRGHCTPIDLGRNFIDGRRVFGDGKTYEGFICGVLSGYSLSLIVYTCILLLAPDVRELFILPGPVDVFLMCVLALSGDLLGAFIKRRLGLPRGAPAPLLDQLDFVVFPLTYVYLRFGITDSLFYLLAVVLTVGLHLFTNFVAYKLGVKREPW